MHPVEALGPDGMSPFFYQKFWSVIHSDTINTIIHILNSNGNSTELNHTFIVLIPKIKHPKMLNNFRHISLFNLIIRIISKTIAN